jgi:hypothetical protein
MGCATRSIRVCAWIEKTKGEHSFDIPSTLGLQDSETEGVPGVTVQKEVMLLTLMPWKTERTAR